MLSWIIFHACSFCQCLFQTHPGWFSFQCVQRFSLLVLTYSFSFMPPHLHVHCLVLILNISAQTFNEYDREAETSENSLKTQRTVQGCNRHWLFLNHRWMISLGRRCTPREKAHKMSFLKTNFIFKCQIYFIYKQSNCLVHRELDRGR